MAARRLDGKGLAERIRTRLTEEVSEVAAAGKRAPGLAVVRVGDDPASEVYVRHKEQACAEAGIRSLGTHLPADATAADIRGVLEALNRDDAVDGILLQLPLPNGIDPDPLIRAIDPDKDVDGFHPVNGGRLLSGTPGFVPCTPRGIMALLADAEVELKGREAVVVGRSNIVGKPAALLLLQAHATVTVCHSRTVDLPQVTRRADIVVVAVGVPGFLGADGIKPGATVIDVGVNRITDPDLVGSLVSDPRRLAAFEKRGRLLVGDVRFEEASEVAAAITPVPGGVGPLTVAMLLENTWDAYRARENSQP